MFDAQVSLRETMRGRVRNGHRCCSGNAMQPRLSSGQTCSMARAFTICGERWIEMNRWLVIGGALSAVVAALHVAVILGGPDWSASSVQVKAWLGRQNAVLGLRPPPRRSRSPLRKSSRGRSAPRAAPRPWRPWPSCELLAVYGYPDVRSAGLLSKDSLRRVDINAYGRSGRDTVSGLRLTFEPAPARAPGAVDGRLP